MPNLLRN